MLLTFIGLVILSVVFVFSVSNTKYHILESVKGVRAKYSLSNYGRIGH